MREERTSAPAEHYRRTVELLVGSGEVDAVIVIFVPPLLANPAAVARAVRDAAATAGPVAVLSVMMSTADPPPEDGDGPRLPRYRFPEDAAYALVRAVEYGDWRRRPPGTVPELPEARPDEAAALLAGALAAGRGGGWLPPAEVARLLACYGLPVAEAVAVRGLRSRGSWSSGWSPTGSSCWWASSTTPPSAPWSPAGPGGRRWSCSRTWPCASPR